MKWIGMYTGFFVAMLALALFVTGVFQQGILPRVWGGKTTEALRSDGAPAPPSEDSSGKGAAASAATPEPNATTGQAAVGSPSPLPAATGPTAKPSKENASDGAAPVKRLARMYEGMRPREAASVIEKLERSLAVRVLSEVKDRQAAKILGAMNPGTAAELTRLLGQASDGDHP